ncbi:VanZ family protein [Amnibacterium setariae]|nr:VanZ family protein [Amnibacterium setariae]
MRRPRLLRVLAAAAALLVLVVLLAPAHTDLPIAWLSASHLLGNAAAGGTPLWWALEDLANIALFAPLGAALALRLRPVPAWLVAVAASACCETAQLWIPTRHASVLDVAMNTIGAAAGVVLVRLAKRTTARRAAQASATRPHSVQAQ